MAMSSTLLALGSPDAVWRVSGISLARYIGRDNLLLWIGRV